MDFSTLILTLLFSSVSLHPPQLTMADRARKGFTFELIHRDSIDSPLYPGNLTSTERLERLVRFSKDYALSLESSTIQPQEPNIRPIVAHSASTYMVRVAIGSTTRTLHLMLANTVSTIWTQCEPCNPCFPQAEPKFQPLRSHTYQQIPCNHPICQPPVYSCVNEACVYNLRIGDNRYTKGTMATEYFTFPSRSSGHQETVPDLIFGCSHESSTTMFSSTKVSGVMAMSQGRESFIMQLANSLHGNFRFSYCLIPVKNTQGSSYLRVGTDATIGANAQSTPILRTNYIQYHVALEDISVDGHRLRLPRDTFSLHANGTGGCTVDPAVGLSMLIRPAYNRVKEELIDYFTSFNISTVRGTDVHLDLCFHLPAGFKSFPSIDLHFQGGNLHVAPPNLFRLLRRTSRFCLLILPDDGQTVLGVEQQQNVNFVYDLGQHRLYFAPEDCAHHN